jgi:hypothetical protein
MSEALAQIDALEGLGLKDRGCLRLLTEEMFSMCRELLATDSLDFEVKRDEGRYILRTVTKTRVDEKAREQFLSMSSSGKNAANQGIKGMLGAVLEALESGVEQECSTSMWAYGMQIPNGEYTYMWTLSQYMKAAPKEKVESEWDGMEKSIIANFADDISIGVRSGKLEMTVTKIF